MYVVKSWLRQGWTGCKGAVSQAAGPLLLCSQKKYGQNPTRPIPHNRYQWQTTMDLPTTLHLPFPFHTRCSRGMNRNKFPRSAPQYMQTQIVFISMILSCRVLYKLKFSYYFYFFGGLSICYPLFHKTILSYFLMQPKNDCWIFLVFSIYSNSLSMFL